MEGQVEQAKEQPLEQEDDARPASRGRSARRVSYASIIGIDDELLSALDEESKALLQEEDRDEDGNERRPRHFKGKGRAWRKDESDEDLEFAPAKKKAAKIKVQAGGVKKRGRPKKSALSEDIIRDDPDTDADVAAGESMAESSAPPTPVLTPASIPKKRGRPRKSALSESVATYDSASENLNGSAPPTPSLSTKQHGRLRKSDQSSVSKDNDDIENDVDDDYSPKKTSSSKPKTKKQRASSPFMADAITPLDDDNNNNDNGVAVAVTVVEEARAPASAPTPTPTPAPTTATTAAAVAVLEDINDQKEANTTTASPSRKRKSASISDGEDDKQEDV